MSNDETICVSTTCVHKDSCNYNRVSTFMYQSTADFTEECIEDDYKKFYPKEG